MEAVNLSYIRLLPLPFPRVTRRNAGGADVTREEGKGKGRDGKNTENPSRLSILLPWFCSLRVSTSLTTLTPSFSLHALRSLREALSEE